MEFTGFEVRNFKGIGQISLELDRSPKGPIFALVGLNESGKTTILEALSYFETEEQHLESLYREEFQHGDANDLIPMKKKPNFNDSIDIAVTLSLTDADKENIVRYARRELSFKIDLAEFSDEITITKKLHFANSIYKSSQNRWAFNSPGLPLRGKKKRELLNFDRGKWLKLVGYIRDQIPSILYFPTFLFDFPTKIYLHSDEDESATNTYYRSIIQDILDSLNDNLKIEKHIVERALDGSKPSKRNLESVLNKMGNAVTKTVFESWNEVFDKKIPRKDIVIKYDVEDLEVNGELKKTVFLEFVIKDGDNLYLITERSLGFRWFFCFLLFTQFRQFRHSQADTLFLFDEPASNLHSRAQMELVKSFAKITEKTGKIIYSTHSHYMINPHWLENAYIVRNEGLRYDDSSAEYDYSSKDTDIKIEPYRKFVGENPDKLTYFQPILDTLDYVPSNLESIPDAVLVEGKNDYYLFNYFETVISSVEDPVNFIPGIGASGLDTLIALYLGWGRNFIVVLDDDREGRKNKQRYIKDWLLPSERVLTLGDISQDWSGKTSEKLISDSDLNSLKSKFYPGKTTGKVYKKEIVRAIQELLLQSEKFKFTKETKDNFEKLTTFCRKELFPEVAKQAN